MSKNLATLSVDLKAVDQQSYTIYIGEGINSNPQLWHGVLHSFKAGRQIAVVTNETIADLYLDDIHNSLDGYVVLPIIIPEGERHKKLSTMALIYDALSESGFNRSATLVALGGGVIGDITGFVAATWMRGVNYIQVPTTLLAQVDSSVGGKTGVNLATAKNMVGCFYHPRAVMIDLTMLSSLPDREFKSGLAEIIKYGLIADAGFYQWLEEHIDGLLKHDRALLTYAIKHSCVIKAKVVFEDEKEQGLRAILNFGHTFGHAIETLMGYGEWLHGEAIAAGMVYAAKLSRELGLIQDREVARMMALFQRVKLPILGPQKLTYEDYWQVMCRDKKSRDKGLSLVLLKAIGEAVVSDDYDEKQIHKVLTTA